MRALAIATTLAFGLLAAVPVATAGPLPCEVDSSNDTVCHLDVHANDTGCTYDSRAYDVEDHPNTWSASCSVDDVATCEASWNAAVPKCT